MHPKSPITDYARLIPPQKLALKKLGIETLIDLLYHFPSRYGDTSETRNISTLEKGDLAVIFGRISKLKTSKGFKTKIPMADAWVEDESGKIHCVWFNQPYLAKMTKEDSLVRIEGKISQRRSKSSSPDIAGELYFSNPKLEIVNKLPTGVGDSLFGDDGKAHTLYPVYPESRGITSNWLYHKIIDIFKNGLLDHLTDPIPKEILDKYNLPSLKTALIWIHTPMRNEDAESARKRFAFEEVFFIQLEKQITRKAYEKNPAFKIEAIEKNVDEFIKRFPFEATLAQRNSINTVLNDFNKSHAMSRLLEGDVGSGKTAVAATTAYAVVTTTPKGRKFGNLQVAYMCPTEILATQHFESFIKYFTHTGISIGLITGSGCRKFPTKVASSREPWTNISRAQLLKWVANGEIPIVIGTHALIAKSVKFKHLALAIVDEQHRFGLKQRKSLAEKTSDGAHVAPHFLSMTATPIPRTLALTLYGDLDLSLLDSMPIGRKPAQTTIVSVDKREQMYADIKKQLIEGRQLYIICPRISDPDPDLEIKMQLRSVTAEAENIQKNIFPEYSVGVLHSKMTPIKKDAVMREFASGKINILVATSVVEVGVNVPNATVMIIEGAERFGLAQLHQLRGRILRSNHQPYCYLVPDTKSVKTADRLKALITAKNGFELSELDLTLRGAGELSGFKQWGVSDIGMEAIKNIKMVEAARTEAKAMVETDLTLRDYPTLAKKISEKNIETHFE